MSRRTVEALATSRRAPEPVYVAVGAALREARVAAGMSTADAAAALGTVRQKVWAYEAAQARIPLYRLVEAAHLYRVSPASLLPGPPVDRAGFVAELSAAERDALAAVAQRARVVIRRARIELPPDMQAMEG
jgi:transcriptional regulator with XRE-family HTH domain